MKIYKSLKIKKIHKNAVIAIGNFDGLHLGHQKVLSQARLKAKKENLRFGVISFEPIPNMFFNKREFNSIYDFSVYRKFLYLIIRYSKPKKVAETGVLHGLTTAWILKALEDNKMGKLISIDLKRSDWPKYFKNKKMGPGYQFDMDFPEEEDAGWIVPDYLKNKWKLNYGPSSMYIEKIKNIDLFIHDSDHSYKNVKFEVETVLKNNKNSFVVIDNCNWNSYIFKLISQLNSNYYKQKLIYSFIDDVDDNLKSLESAVVFKKI